MVRFPKPGVRLEQLAADNIVLVVPPDHPSSCGIPCGWELRGQSLVLREEGSGARRSVEQAQAAAGLTLPLEDVALTLDSTRAIFQAAVQELGLGFAPARAAARAGADGNTA